MCVYSMVVDHKWGEWSRRYPRQPVRPSYPPFYPQPVPSPIPSPPTQDEIDEFRRLLERAREYDKRNNEPACEEAEKKKKLLALAEELGVKIDFL